MDWNMIGAIGEFSSAIAVLVTLVYLAIQIRNANRFEAVKHLDVHMDRIRQRLLLVAENGDLARIERIASAGGDLSEDDARRWRALANHHILVLRDAWLRARMLGNMPGLQTPTIYLDILAAVLARNVGMRRIWDEMSSESVGVTWSNEFVDYINGKLAKSAE